MDMNRESTHWERERWGICDVCEAPHGTPCRADIGFQLGQRVDGRRMLDGEGAHLARLRKAPETLPVIPSPIFGDTLTTTTTIAFGFWQRVRIFLGWRVCVQTVALVLVDRTAPHVDPKVEPRIWDWHPWRRNRPQSGMLQAP